MFNKKYSEKLYIKALGLENLVKAKIDFLCFDPEVSAGNLIMLSSIDAPAKLDKIRADYNKGVLNEIAVYDENSENMISKYSFGTRYLNLRETKLNIIKKKNGDLSHMIMCRDNNSPYIFKFSNEISVNELVMSKLINIYFIPCNIELVQEVLASNNNILKEMIIISDNENLNNVEIYKFNKDLFVETLNNISKMKGEVPDPIFEKFKGDFTGYINYFKKDILENLNSKMDQFYDPDNVPEYVTQFPYPLPNKDMKTILNRISNKLFNKNLGTLNFKETVKTYESYKKLDKEGRIKRDENFNPDWSRQKVCWAAGMEMLKKERFLYASLVMGAGKTLMALKVNKYTCEETLKRKNHCTFILCPQSTITQWIGEIELIEKGKGHTKDDYDVIVISKTKDFINFFETHSKIKNGGIKFNKKSLRKPTYLLCGKEAFKLSQTKRPAFNISLNANDKPVLICPNCGRPLVTISSKGKETPMTLSTFFNKNFKKLLNSSNVFCPNCVSDLELKEKIIESKKNHSQEEIDIPKFLSNDKKIWTYDFETKNDTRNKIFGKIVNTTPLTNEYTNFKDIKELKERLEKRREIKQEIIKKHSLRDIDNINIGTKKVSVIEFIKKRRMFFDTVIIDEAHEGNNASSIIGTAQRLLFKYSQKTILLSGTCNSGYASSLHNLLKGAMPEKLKEDGTFEKIDFIKKYGILQGTLKLNEEGKISGKSELSDSAFKEIEGISPVVFIKFLVKNFIMVNTLQDLDLPMPELVEKYVPIDCTPMLTNYYNRFVNDVSNINDYIGKIFRASVFKNYINNPYSWNPVEVPVPMTSDVVLVEPSCVDRNKFKYTEKDFELLGIVKKEKQEGRKCFIFTDFNDGGKYIKEELYKDSIKPVKVTLNDRICDLFEQHGIRYKVISTTTTSVANRKNYIDSVKDEYDVFICQPQLVNVGLNLVFCPTYIVYTPYYRYDIISQATRRGYRANSTIENRIYHLYYKNTCEEIIINRYQRKLAEAKAIEGEFFVNIEKGKKVRTLSKTSDEIVKN